MAQNKFLQDFMRTQNRLLEIEANDKSVKKDRKGNRKAVHKTADGKAAFGDDDELARIIKEKPGKKEVIDYFRKRIGELVAEDMA
jgi:hypothetical protein